MTFGRRLMFAMLGFVARIDEPTSHRTVIRGDVQAPLVQRIDGGFLVTFIAEDNSSWVRFCLPDETAQYLADQIVDGLTRTDGGIHD